MFAPCRSPTVHIRVGLSTVVLRSSASLNDYFVCCDSFRSAQSAISMQTVSGGVPRPCISMLPSLQPLYLLYMNHIVIFALWPHTPRHRGRYVTRFFRVQGGLNSLARSFLRRCRRATSPILPVIAFSIAVLLIPT